MRLNPSKTTTMIVSRSRTVEPDHPALHVDNVDVPESTNLDVLGVKLDKELTFKAHVRDLASRASRNVGIVRKAARVFQDHSISLTCVRSFVLPLFEYCSPVWGSACQSHLSVLDRVARRAVSVRRIWCW